MESLAERCPTTRAQILMNLCPRKEPRYNYLISQNSRQTKPLQIPQQGTHRERGPSTGNLASLSKTPSFGFPGKELIYIHQISFPYWKYKLTMFCKVE
jgi:hypothetical protein